MSIFKKRMMSMRQMIGKMRARTIVAVISTSVLATAGIGVIVYKSIDAIDVIANETTVENSFKHEYIQQETEEMTAGIRDISDQTADIREYLTNLLTEVENNAALLDEFSHLFSEDSGSEEIKVSRIFKDVQTDLGVLQDKIETALIQIGVMESNIKKGAIQSKEGREQIDTQMQELQVLLSGIDERYLMVKSEMDRLLVVMNGSGLMQTAKIAETIEKFKKFSHSDSEAMGGIADELSKTSNSLTGLYDQAALTQTAIDKLGAQIVDNAACSSNIEEQLALTKTDIASLQTKLDQISSEQKVIVDMLTTTNSMLAEVSNTNQSSNELYALLKQQLNQQNQGLEELRETVSAHEQSILDLGSTLVQSGSPASSSRDGMYGIAVSLSEEYGILSFGDNTYVTFDLSNIMYEEEISKGF